MKLSKTRGGTAIGMNLTPMIDIVFLLIIFFITASQITPLVNFPVRLPQVPEKGDPPRLIAATINVDRAGRYVMGGQTRRLEEIVPWLRSLAAETGSEIQDLRVLIRADRTAQSGHINRLVPQLAELGIREIKFSVQGVGSSDGP